jgi:hypothetical protein
MHKLLRTAFISTVRLPRPVGLIIRSHRKKPGVPPETCLASPPGKRRKSLGGWKHPLGFFPFQMSSGRYFFSATVVLGSVLGKWRCRVGPLQTITVMDYEM